MLTGRLFAWNERGRMKERRGGQEARWMDVNIKAMVRMSTACRQKPQGGKRADEKKPKGSVMALRMRDSPSSSQGHTTSKSCQSAGSQERRGEHTRTHSTVQRLSVTSLIQRCSAAATPFVHISLFQVWLDWLMENRQPAAAKNPGLRPVERARCINAPCYWLFTLASLLSPHPLLLFHSPYLSYISFSPSLAISLALARFLSPRTHTCTLFLSLSELSRLRCMQNWKEEGENVEAWHPWSLFINLCWKKL